MEDFSDVHEIVGNSDATTLILGLASNSQVKTPGREVTDREIV